MVDFFHPMVPVTVHQVFRRIRIGLAQERIRVHRTLDGTLDRADVHELAAIRRESELADTAFHLRNLDTLAQFTGLVGRLPNLAFPKEINGVSFRRPTCVREALSVHRQLRFLAAFDREDKEVPDAAVLRDIRVTHTVKDGLSIGGKLRIGEPAEGQEHFRRHPTVFDLELGRTDVALLGFHGFIFTREEGKNRQCEG